MIAPVDVLAVMEAESNRRLTNYNAAAIGEAPEALVDRLHVELHEMATARSAVAELIEADERNIETLDSLIHAMALPMPDELHMKALREALPRLLEEKCAALARVQGSAKEEECPQDCPDCWGHGILLDADIKCEKCDGTGVQGGAA